MTRRVFWILVGSLCGVGCNCEEMLATKRTGAPPPIVARPVEVDSTGSAPVENAQPYRPPPVAQVPSPLPAQRPVPVIPPPGSIPLPPPEPVEGAKNDGPLPADTPEPGPIPVPSGGPLTRPLKPIRFPSGIAKSLFNRGAPVMSAPPAGVTDETKAKK